MEIAKHLEVELTFLLPAEGGRSTPVETGYHPQFTYDGIGWSAIHTYIGKDQVYPGETAKAYITFYTIST